jgi:hypothetical protein
MPPGVRDNASRSRVAQIHQSLSLLGIPVILVADNMDDWDRYPALPTCVQRWVVAEEDLGLYLAGFLFGPLYFLSAPAARK